jgi:hypothetical protein
VVCVLALTVTALTLHYVRPVHAVGTGREVPARGAGAGFGDLPISFEKNEGQAPPEVKFIGRGLGHTTYLTESEAVLVFAAPAERGARPSRGPGRDAGVVAGGATQVVRIKPAGASPGSGVAGVERLPGDANYFIGGDPSGWKTDVATFGKVHYESVYPGIGLTYYGNQGQLEFDFTVAPGADPGLIGLTYAGVEALLPAADGALRLKTAAGDLLQSAPIIYQEEAGRRVGVEGEYVLREDRSVGFRVRDYDRSKPLVIDPVIRYSTFLGGAGGEAAFAVAVDSAGNSYVTGLTRSTDFPTVSPAQGAAGGGARDVFVTKINPTGSAILYSTYVGGSGDEQGVDVAINSSGGAYVTGWTTSTNYPLASPFQNFYGGGSNDGFLTRLSPAGNSIVYSTYAGGSGTDVGTGVALDSSGNIYGIGYTNSPNLQLVNAFQPFKGAGFDAYLVKTDAAGAGITYSTYLGGNGDDFGNKIAVDGSGNVYGVGDTGSTDLLTVGGVQTFYAGGGDAYVAKLSANGSALLYGTYAGGSNFDSGTAITLDSSNNIYVAGFTESTNLTMVNALQPLKKGGDEGGFDGFFAKLNSSGSSILYSSYLGGDGDDILNDIAVDSAGTLFLTGQTEAPNFPLVNPVQALNGGGLDVFLSRVSASGSSLLYSTYLGGGGNDVGWGVGADGQGNAYVVGQAISSNYPVSGSLQPFRGTSDAFVTKVSPEAVPASVQFHSASITASEDFAEVDVFVVRTGDTSAAASVVYATQDGSAVDTRDYTAALGTLDFAPGGTVAVIRLLLTDDRFAEGAETLTVSLNNVSGAALGSPAVSTITINDNDSANGPSPVRWDASFDTSFFVRQHYHDFLNREPDPNGFAFWTNEIDSCTDAACREVKRINVSAAFFLSIEFQETGYLVERVYKTAYGDATSPNVPGTVPVVKLREYLADTQRIGQGVEVGVGDWRRQLEDNKNVYALEFVQRQRFLDAFPPSMTPAQFVDKLDANAGLVLTQAERDQLVAQLAANDTAQGRAAALRAVAEHETLKRREFNRAFVLMQFFGYLRRDPDAAPDSDFRGWRFWLDKLEQFNGDFIQAEMVKAFLLSDEYRQRFGQ